MSPWIKWDQHYPFLAALLSNSIVHCSPSSWLNDSLTFFMGMWFLRHVIKFVSLSCLYSTPLTCWKCSQPIRGKQVIPFPICLVLTGHLMFPYWDWASTSSYYVCYPFSHPLSQGCKSLWKDIWLLYQHKPGAQFYFYLWLSHLANSLCLLNSMANMIKEQWKQTERQRISWRGL